MSPTPAINVGPEPAGIVQLEQLFSRIIFLSVGIAFIALTILLVYAAIKFLTSGGNKKELQGAWGIITWAFLGIFFMGLAWLIILLIQSFTGVTLTQFSLQWPGN
jgi:uncharacterized membrane protein